MEVLSHCLKWKRHDNSIITDLWKQCLEASNFGPGRDILSIKYVPNGTIHWSQSNGSVASIVFMLMRSGINTKLCIDDRHQLRGYSHHCGEGQNWLSTISYMTTTNKLILFMQKHFHHMNSGEPKLKQVYVYVHQGSTDRSPQA